MAIKNNFDQVDRRIAFYIACGKCYQEIGQDVGLSEVGVRYRVNQMRDRVGAGSTVTLIANLASSGFFSESEVREICAGTDVTIC